MLGGFPPPSGDTSLGTVLSFKGEAVFPLSTFDTGESPASFRTLTLQGANWYAGCSLYLRDLGLSLGHQNRFTLAHLLMSFKRWLENMIWCLGPLAWFISALYAVYSSAEWLLALLVLVFCVHTISLIFVLLGIREFLPEIKSDGIAKIPDTKDFVKPLFCYPIMLLGACLGPLTYYVLRVWSCLLRRRMPRWKTKRDNTQQL